MRYTSYINTYDITSCVKKLIIINIALWFFLVVIFQKHFTGDFAVFKLLGLTPSLVFFKYYIWQIFTYIFIHAHSIFHILFNMFVLWMFGSELEKLWGSRFFLLYYIACGVGAALLYLFCLGVYILGFNGDVQALSRPVIGASGAVFGLLYAYGFIYSERIIYMMMIFPIKARNFTLLIAAIELVTLLNSGFGSPVANLAHLGGIVSGIVFLRLWKWFQKFNLQRWKKRFKGKSHLTVVKDDDNTYFH